MSAHKESHYTSLSFNTPSATFTQVLRYLPAELRYGFTATPDRVDGSPSLMHWYIGPEIARIIANKLKEYPRFNGPGR